MANDGARAAPEALPGRLPPALLLRIGCRPDLRRPDDTGIRRAARASAVKNRQHKSSTNLEQMMAADRTSKAI
ncbi:hypothetical protein [Burkholderia plantarii]|uniref:hypothetical protein n=1 Tax=Burkholderia plantarii TaxID=41899 RepID=UPI00114CF49C|nr:hypothetical protein [Burkholderia plantarii]